MLIVVFLSNTFIDKYKVKYTHIIFFSDVDDCFKETHNCSSDAVCNNTSGPYNCSCKAGNRGDGKNCSIGGTFVFWSN